MEEKNAAVDVKIEEDHTYLETGEATQDEHLEQAQQSYLEEKQRNVVENDIMVENLGGTHTKAIKYEETMEEIIEAKEVKEKIEETIKQSVENELIKKENEIEEDTVKTLDENLIEAMEPGELPTNSGSMYFFKI